MSRSSKLLSSQVPVSFQLVSSSVVSIPPMTLASIVNPKSKTSEHPYGLFHTRYHRVTPAMLQDGYKSIVAPNGSTIYHSLSINKGSPWSTRQIAHLSPSTSSINQLKALSDEEHQINIPDSLFEDLSGGHSLNSWNYVSKLYGLDTNIPLVQRIRYLAQGKWNDDLSLYINGWVTPVNKDWFDQTDLRELARAYGYTDNLLNKVSYYTFIVSYQNHLARQYAIYLLNINQDQLAKDFLGLIDPDGDLLLDDLK